MNSDDGLKLTFGALAALAGVSMVGQRLGSSQERYSLAALEAMPTLSVGQADNLKVDLGDTRIWLARVVVDDGMPYDNMVTVEKLVDGIWETVEEYPALRVVQWQ
jgi:hypothetical protein